MLPIKAVLRTSLEYGGSEWWHASKAGLPKIGVITFYRRQIKKNKRFQPGNVAHSAKALVSSIRTCPADSPSILRPLGVYDTSKKVHIFAQANHFRVLRYSRHWWQSYPPVPTVILGVIAPEPRDKALSFGPLDRMHPFLGYSHSDTCLAETAAVYNATPHVGYVAQ